MQAVGELILSPTMLYNICARVGLKSGVGLLLSSSCPWTLSVVLVMGAITPGEVCGLSGGVGRSCFYSLYVAIRGCVTLYLQPECNFLLLVDCEVF